MLREKLFRETLKENDARIKGICRHFFGTIEEAHDAYQEILLKIWLNIEGFRGESQLKTWVTRVAVNVCLTSLAKSKRKSEVLVPFSQTGYGDAISDDEEQDPEEEMKLKFFRRFMDKLSATDKSLVSLYLEDMDTREISQSTGISEANVRVRIHRIRKQIKKEWEEGHGT